jgi:hypothetical protein
VNSLPAKVFWVRELGVVLRRSGFQAKSAQFQGDRSTTGKGKQRAALSFRLLSPCRPSIVWRTRRLLYGDPFKHAWKLRMTKKEAIHIVQTFVRQLLKSATSRLN